MKNNINLECQFWFELEQFGLSHGETNGVNVNGNAMPIAFWNLICSIRDIGLYNKGIVINRNWKITPVKKYFGWVGRDNILFLEYLNDIKDYVKNEAGAKEKMLNKWGIYAESDESLNLSDESI
jgi:hypothetical protein